VLLRRSSGSLTLTLRGVETNSEGVVIANIVVSNTSPHEFFLWLHTNPDLVHPGRPQPLAPLGSSTWRIQLPMERPCHVLANATVYLNTSRLSDRVRYTLAHYVSDSFQLARAGSHGISRVAVSSGQ
jgi:hypothetical protein